MCGRRDDAHIVMEQIITINTMESWAIPLRVPYSVDDLLDLDGENSDEFLVGVD